MTLSLLDRYPAIGWDFDNTLLGHGASPAMHAYILAHPEKKHYIVTFRSHGWQDLIWQDFSDQYPNSPVGPQHFQGVFNMPDEIFATFHRREQTAFLSYGDIAAYLSWKGEVCFDNAIPVLVDDMPDMVMAGCKKFDITHIHPDVF